jgi:hypothetical protein
VLLLQLVPLLCEHEVQELLIFGHQAYLINQHLSFVHSAKLQQLNEELYVGYRWHHDQLLKFLFRGPLTQHTLDAIMLQLLLKNCLG